MRTAPSVTATGSAFAAALVVSENNSRSAGPSTSGRCVGNDVVMVRRIRLPGRAT